MRLVNGRKFCGTSLLGKHLSQSTYYCLRGFDYEVLRCCVEIELEEFSSERCTDLFSICLRLGDGSYDEALIKAQQALEIEEKELGGRAEQMADLYRLLADICVEVQWITRYNYSMIYLVINCKCDCLNRSKSTLVIALK